MYNVEQIQISENHSASAFAKMRALDVPATPRNYTIWYTYFAGDDPRLVKVLDSHALNDKCFDEHLACEVYSQFFADSGEMYTCLGQ